MEEIINLAQKEGKKLNIYNDLDDINLNIPFFQIEDSIIKIGGYKHHDNAPRMLYWANYLQKKILPNLENGVNINGYYNIELHDSYTHLDHIVQERNGIKTSSYDENKKISTLDEYKNCLVWSKHKDDEHVVLLPDIYQLSNYGNKFSSSIYKDPYNWDNKKDKIGFWGTTTGNQDPLKNRRIQTCLWFLERDPTHLFSECFITNIAQIKKNVLLDNISKFPLIYHKPVDFFHQYNYKFLLDIPGNTCSWDRLPLIMNSKSLFFKMSCDDMCFYYPLLKEKTHYIDVSLKNDDILKKREFYLNNPKKSEDIIQNASLFAQNYLHQDSAQQYIISLFTEAYYHKKA